MSLGTILIIIVILYLLGGWSGRIGGTARGGRQPGRTARLQSPTPSLMMQTQLSEPSYYRV